MEQPDTISVGDVVYRREDLINEGAQQDSSGHEYVIIRTQNAGVFAGYLVVFDDTTSVAVLVQARRLWRWYGAASLSQLAVDGTSKPKECKFPVEVPKIVLSQVIEITETTEKARKAIASVAVWTA